MSKQPSTTDDLSTDTVTKTEQTTDWKAAVVDAIQHLEGYDVTDMPPSQRAFDLKAAHDRLFRLDTSDAPRHAAETIQDAVDRLDETDDVTPDVWGIIAKGALADLAPLAARVARRRASTYGSPVEGTEPLEAIVEGRDTLQRISFDDVGDKRCSRLINALEALDNILIDASPEEFASIGGAQVNAGDSEPAAESIDELPTVEQPTDAERHTARRRYGAEAVPEEGAIPDPNHEYSPQVTVTVPEWALEATRRFLESHDPAELDRTTVQGALFEHVQVDDQLRMPDGRDAVDTLLEEYADD